MKAKRRTVAEQREKFAYEFHSEARVLFVARLGCAACGRKKKVENHHTRNGGMGRKGPYWVIVPLCGTVPGEGHFGCHQRCEQIGKLSFLQQLHRDGKRLTVGGTPCDSWEEAAEITEKLGVQQGFLRGD